jgi:hypothetical protein
VVFAQLRPIPNPRGPSPTAGKGRDRPCRLAAPESDDSQQCRRFRPPPRLPATGRAKLVAVLPHNRRRGFQPDADPASDPRDRRRHPYRRQARLLCTERRLRPGAACMESITPSISTSTESRQNYADLHACLALRGAPSTSRRLRTNAKVVLVTSRNVMVKVICPRLFMGTSQVTARFS